MPIYEYVCKKSKNKFELMRTFSRSQEAADCPICRAKAERILSTCYAKTSGESGVAKNIEGSGRSCSSCSSGNCGTCGH